MDTAPRQSFPSPEVEALRAAIFRAKAKRRISVRQAPIEEKLRMLEEMRDFSALLRPLREQHQARVKSAWTQR
jgi:hypothetical protein